MSNSPQQDEPHESDAVSRGSLSPNEETPTQPDSLPKSDPETVPPAPPVPDPDEISPGEDEDDDEEGEELEEENPAVSSTMDLRIHPPTTEALFSSPDVILVSPTGRRGGGKRKKGKGKPSTKKQQAIESKLQTLRQNLNPIPFIPHKILDFAHHEKLLKNLGLWEFVQIDFDRTLRVEFIAQLVANYNAKSRGSNVNGFRVAVNRADLARSLKLPSRKERAEFDLDSEVLSEDSIGFVLGLLSDWVLLHEELWLMPNEVAEWMKLIKEGHPEKVDWAGLLWFMIEKELKQGGQLKDCYYASHLQHLIKHQRANLFVVEEPTEDEVELVSEANKEVELVSEANKEVEDGDNENIKDSDAAVKSTEELREGDSVMQGPSTELTLGQDAEKEDEGEGVKDDVEGGMKDMEMMDAEKCKDCSDEEVGGGDQDQDQEPWLLNMKEIPDEHFLQRCSAENGDEFGNVEDRKEEEEEMDEDEDGEEDEDEARNNFHDFPNDDSLEGDGFTGNFLQGLEGNQMAFSTQEQLRNASSVDTRVDVQHPSFFNNSGKRVIEHDYHHSVNDNNSKRMRIAETWDNKPPDFAMCMEQMQQAAQRVRMLYEEKEQAVEQSGMHQQLLLSELQKRDAMIDHLHKARLDETQKKDIAIKRLERELYLMGSVLDGYRKALKETRKAFAEYKERAQLPEEPTYKDAGPGGLMLTAAEMERCRKKMEEEFKMNCLYVEQKMKEVEEEYAIQFHEHVERVNLLDDRLIGLEADAKELLTAMNLKRKTPPSEPEEVVGEVVETPLPVPEPMEEEALAEEVSKPEPEPEPVAVPEPEEQLAADAVAGDEQPGEKVDEPLPVE